MKVGIAQVLIIVFLFTRYDIFTYDRTKIRQPISKQLYSFLNDEITGFIEWYEQNKPDEYMPNGGLMKMPSLNLIKKVNLMNKHNANFEEIMTLWCTRYNNRKIDKNDDFKRCEINELVDIPNDPIINIF